MKKPFGGIVLDTAFRIIVPFTLIYGVYVLIFGEAGPGGGFQAGALLSIGVVLSRLIMGDHASFNISVKNSLVLAGVGTFIYAATGWLAMLNGGNFLDYSYLPFKAEHTNELHALGILFIEIKSGSSQEEICGIISSICIDLKREDDFVNVRYENGEYIIINNGITIGRAVINDKATTDLLKIYFCN